MGLSCLKATLKVTAAAGVLGCEWVYREVQTGRRGRGEGEGKDVKEAMPV